MQKDYYLLGEILWGMKDYFNSPDEEEKTGMLPQFYNVGAYKINLGSFDGLSNCDIMIAKGMFRFRTGNYLASPQYEKDKRRFFICCGNLDDKIHFFYDIYDENVIETLKKIITIKIPKKLLHNSHQQMIENSGVLNIRDITNITYTLLAKGVCYIDNNEILEQRRKKELNTLFPPANAEEVRELMANLSRNVNDDEKPVMVDSCGQRNVESRFASRGKITHNNLLGVIPVEEEKEPTLVKKRIPPKK